MSIKKTIKFGLFFLMMISMLFPVSCKKRMPESPLNMEKQQGTAVSKANLPGKENVSQSAAGAVGEENLAQKAGAAGKSAEAATGLKADTVRNAFLQRKVYFDFDDATLDSDDIAILTKQAKWLRSHPEVFIVIEGYCDERGTEEYNLALGARRAESVKSFLLKAGIDASRMMTISYGEERPADPGHNEAAWAKNRRVEFSIR